MDFFWDGMQQKADSISQGPGTPYPWAAKSMSASKLAKRVLAWEEATKKPSLLGTESSAPLSHALKLFHESYQLGLLTGNARHIDLAERILVNRILPLWQTDNDEKAKAEATQLLRSIDQFVYAESGKDIYVNMFTRCNAHIKNKDIDLFLSSTGNTPWYYETTISIASNMDPFQIVDSDTINKYQRIIYYEETKQDSCEATFHIRIPSWCNGKNFLSGYDTKCRKGDMQIYVNGVPVKESVKKDGYIVISGKWALRDIISVKIPTPIIRVTDKDNPGMIALQRGPFVYYFITASDNAKIIPDNPISQTFINSDNAIVLSGLADDNSDESRFYALPYYRHSEKAKLFMPVK